MPKDYIPRPDGDFKGWLNQYIAGATDWWDHHGGDGPLDDLRDLRTAWVAAFAASVAADAAAQAKTAAKNDARAACEVELRRMTRLIQGTPDTTDAQRAAIGITVTSPGNGTPSPAPTSRPLVRVDGGTRLTHTLRMVDESAPTRRGKPGGVLGAEVWRKLVEPGSPAPTDPQALSFVELTTRPVVRTEFRAEDGGKTAVYMLRWVSTRGEKGPWSEVCTATVAA